MKSLQASLKSPLWYLFVALIAWAFIGVEPASAGPSDKCKDHDRCKAHDKCKQHDRGHAKCPSKPGDDARNGHDDDDGGKGHDDDDNGKGHDDDDGGKGHDDDDNGKGHDDDDGGKNGDKCKDHDRCKDHNKCRQHDKGHAKCKPKVDKCKDHDRCKDHDKCRQHDKAHAKCKPKVDKCKDHDRCKDHDKCRQHDKAHAKCKPKEDKCKDHDRCKDHDKCRQHDKAHARCKPKEDKCKDHDRCRAHDKCREHDKDHKNCPSKREATFGGRAVTVYLTNLNVGPSTILIGDTGPLPAEGGTIQVNVESTNLMNALLIDMAESLTTAEGNRAYSEASIQEFSIRFTTTNGMEHTITFDHVLVTATAECDESGAARVSTDFRIQDLEINGTEITVTGEANQIVNIDGGQIIINAQSSTTAGGHGSITVAGLYIRLDGCMEGPIGLAHAEIRCGSGPPQPRDCSKVTGAGAIRGTPSGDLGAFCITAGTRGEFIWGRLHYLDYDTEVRFKSTAITGFTRVDQTTALITYNVTIDGAAGTATVEVMDNSKSGKSDTFAITLSNGYQASGVLCRGNIKFHKCPKHCKKKCDGGHHDDDDGKSDDDDDDGKDKDHGKDGRDDDDDD